MQITEHLGLVHLVARRIKKSSSKIAQSTELDELIGLGMVGLVQAAEGFDASRDVAFSTYAVPRIRGSILDGLRDAAPLGRAAMRQVSKLRTTEARLVIEKRRHPTRREVAEALGLSDKQLREWEQHVQGLDPKPLEYCTSEGHSTLPDAITRLEAEERERVLAQAFATLDDRERYVLTRVFWHDEPYVDVAATLGVSEARVFQIRKAALLRLRTLIGEHHNVAS